MLQQVLDFFRQHKKIPLSQEAVSAQLGLTPAVVSQLLHTLVQRGRLVELDEACTGCEICPLHQLCAGAHMTTGKAYVLAPERATNKPNKVKNA